MHLNPRAMQLGNFLHDGKSQAAALAGSAG
jgi:hypothetical protein